MNRGANVVDEARQRQLRRPNAAADVRLGLEDDDPSQNDRGSEAVRSRPDDDRIVATHRVSISVACLRRKSCCEHSGLGAHSAPASRGPQRAVCARWGATERSGA